MANTSKIEWTERTWNPAVGCTKVSPGCKNCYAETMATRLKAMGTPGYEDGFKLKILPSRLDEPLKRKTPTTYSLIRCLICFTKKYHSNLLNRSS